MKLVKERKDKAEMGRTISLCGRISYTQ